MTGTYRITAEAIENFKAIYEEEFGKTLTDDQASEMAHRLLRIMQVLCSVSQAANPNATSAD